MCETIIGAQNTVADPVSDFPHLKAVNQYGFYCIPEEFRTREVAKLLLAGKVNEPRTLKIMQQFMDNGDIISGGAFIGDFLPILSRTAKRGAFIHSFEPNPTGFAAATHTIAFNGLKNVKLSPVAVGREAAVLPLKIAKSGGAPLGGMSRIVDAPIEGQTVDVQMRRLDDLVPEGRKVTIVQLDVEGHEWPALEGARRIISDSQPLIVLETLVGQEPEVTAQNLREMCPAAGYQFMGMMERNAFYRPLGR